MADVERGMDSLEHRRLCPALLTWQRIPAVEYQMLSAMMNGLQVNVLASDLHSQQICSSTIEI